MTHPALPPPASRPWLLGAAVVWLVVSFLGTPSAPGVSAGSFEGTIRLDTDIYHRSYGSWAVGTTDLGRMLVEIELDASRGDRLDVVGVIDGEPGTAAGKAYRGVLSVRSVRQVTPSEFLPHIAGRTVRQTVIRRLEPFDDARGLLAGFLIGDVSHIRELDVEAMRRSGLAHFVAVSGSNVALFLALLALAAGPLAIGPRRRALVGLAGLPVYAAATGFEPSVMRASVMAGLALSGRTIGIVLEAWQLLALGVTGLVVYDPGLTSNVGFQLSVAATAGVLVGARWPVRGAIRRALALTVGAQLAVAPLLLFHFGSVPLMSPVVNLVAAPLVSGATVLGAVGVAGVTPLLGPAAWLSELVLGLARGASAWPQLSTWQLTAIVVGGCVLWLFPRVRPTVVVSAALVTAYVIVAGGTALPDGAVAVLDVGQGDSILMHGGSGRYVLVDGGPDPSVLIDRLHHYGVTKLELMVVSHVHADHVSGLTGVLGDIPVGEVWAVPEPHTTPAFDDLETAVGALGMQIEEPAVGQRRELGPLTLSVEGPLRRYASPNDQSIVLSVMGPSRSMLLTGDIETFAQEELMGLHADVLKVPHQGAATSDPDWLSSVGAELAVISVGPNQFGHPADWVIEVLEAGGTEVRRTDDVGDVVIDLTRPGT